MVRNARFARWEKELHTEIEPVTIFQDKARAEGREPDELDIAADACLATTRALSIKLDELSQTVNRIRNRLRKINE